jgi:hypothetical protein
VTRVTVYETEISKAFKAEWGDVRQNMRRAANFHVALSQRNAPVRTGTLQRSIGYRIMPAFNRYTTMYTLTVGVNYAEYTLRTTGPWIYSNRGRIVSANGQVRRAAMGVRPAPYSTYLEKTPRTAVKGYISRDWLNKSTLEMMKGMRLI